MGFPRMFRKRFISFAAVILNRPMILDNFIFLHCVVLLVGGIHESPLQVLSKYRCHEYDLVLLYIRLIPHPEYILISAPNILTISPKGNNFITSSITLPIKQTRSYEHIVIKYSL
jgi:hypothetical protein